nr:hypothetical protein [Tanacetum cinerariifolium]
YNEYYVIASGTAPPKMKKSSDEDDDDEVDDRSDDQEDDDDQDDDDQDDNDDDQDTDNDNDEFTPKNSNDESNDDASLGMNVGSKEGHDAKDDNEQLYRDVNINLKELVGVISICYKYAQPKSDAGIDSLFDTTPRVDVQAPTTVAPLRLTAPTLPPPTIPTIFEVP